MSTALTYAMYFGSFFASAVLPWVNAELLMLSLLPLAVQRKEWVALAVIAAAGQMAGKSVLYWLARSGSERFSSERENAALTRWQPLLNPPERAIPVLLLSAVVGFPPFFVLSLLAGSLRMRFRAFLLTGAVGRLLHFGMLALVPGLMWG